MKFINLYKSTVHTIYKIITKGYQESLTVDIKEGKGSEFIITLPI